MKITCLTSVDSHKQKKRERQKTFNKHYFGIQSRTFDQCVVPLVGVVPGEPTDVVVTEATKSYVVLAWKPPVQRGHEGVMYYIEKVEKSVVFCILSKTGRGIIFSLFLFKLE